MKSLTLFLILFIIKSTVSQNKLIKYSIDPFIDNLKKDGNFTIIQSIKAEFGDDVAIISCEEIKNKQSGNCKKVVKEYMFIFPPVIKKYSPGPKSNNKPTPNLSNVNKVALQKILNKNFTKKKAKLLYDKIIKKCKKNKINI